MTKTKISIYALILIILAPLCWIVPEAYYDIKVLSKLDWGIEGINGSAISQEVITVDEPNDSQATSSFKVIETTIYAYTSSVEETDNTPCKNAWGYNICNLHKAGLRIVACPVEYSPDQLFEIDGIIYACFDRMNQELHPNDWDIYFGQGEEAYQRAMEWGVQTKLIKIYE